MTKPIIQLNKPQAVIFDWDDTLVDSSPILLKTLNKTLADFGYPTINMDEMKREWHKSFRDALPTKFGHKTEEVREVYYRNFQEIRKGKLKAFDKAEATLSLIIESDIPITIVSNKRSDFLKEEVIELSWGKYFYKVIGAGDAVKDKPAIEPVHQALYGLSLEDYSNVWFIGDSMSDMRCAQNSSCIPILYATPLSLLDHDITIKPYRVADHKELQQLYNSVL